VTFQIILPTFLLFILPTFSNYFALPAPLSNCIQWRQSAKILMTDVLPIFSFLAIAALVIPSA
jgi:hypothetical protein